MAEAAQRASLQVFTLARTLSPLSCRCLSVSLCSVSACLSSASRLLSLSRLSVSLCVSVGLSLSLVSLCHLSLCLSLSVSLFVCLSFGVSSKQALSGAPAGQPFVRKEAPKLKDVLPGKSSLVLGASSRDSVAPQRPGEDADEDGGAPWTSHRPRD